jgi:glyoxylase-like metal-dependent hydrolase (beta-lactamase superfamily II)
MKKKLIIILSIVAALLVAAGGFVWYQYRQFIKVDVVKVDPQLTIYEGAGNSIVLTSEDGSRALVVDTKMGSAAELLRNEVKAKNITVVNTHDHSDHTGGNALFPGATFIAGSYGKDQWDRDSGGAAYPGRTVKVGEEITIPMGDETVLVRNMGRGHTLNDTVVFLKKRKLLMTGDLVFVGMCPALIKKSGTSVNAWIKLLDDLYARFDVKTLVPGHGPVSDRKAIGDLKDYFVSIRDAIGNKEKLDVLREKYKDYASMPIVMNFNANASFIEDEMKGR